MPKVNQTAQRSISVALPAQLVEDGNWQAYADDRDVPLEVLLACVIAAALERENAGSDEPGAPVVKVTLPARYRSLLANVRGGLSADAWCAQLVADSEDVLDELLIEAIDGRLVPLPPWVG